MYTKSELLNRIIQKIPYPHRDFDLTLDNQIRFTWDETRFRVSLTGMVEEVDNGLLKSNDVTDLLEALIKSGKE